MSSGSEKTILLGTVKGKRRGGSTILKKKLTWMDFTSITKAAKDRTWWKGIAAKSSVVLPTTLDYYRVK